jgi:hypothetical protein
MAYTIRYGKEKKILDAFVPGSVAPSFAASTGVSASITAGGSAEMRPSDEVSIVKFSVGFGGPDRSL